MYAVYHGADGLLRIATKVHAFTQILKSQLENMGYSLLNDSFFDTLTVDVNYVKGGAVAVHKESLVKGINFRQIDGQFVGVTLDESVTPADLIDIINVFASASAVAPVSLSDLTAPSESSVLPSSLIRSTPFLHHSVFNTHHSETEMLRYMHHLQSKDLSLVHSMIPLGSCTMKLNPTSSMIPITMPEFSGIHPFVPVDQAKGYAEIIKVPFDLLHSVSYLTH
jgi:glycine dehydrogenase